jgi:hypothetical protein
MKRTTSLCKPVPGPALLATSVMAAVSADEAAKLGRSLTPMGAEKAGNADGDPAWTGCRRTPAASTARASCPTRSAVKTAVHHHRAERRAVQGKLPGPVAMFKRYPDTFKMPVYPSHRGCHRAG